MTRLWAVIHLSTISLAVNNAIMATAAGAHGVFLIHMDGKDDFIGPAADAIRAVRSDIVMGANFLSLAPLAALEQSLALGLSATWTDRPGVRSDGVSSQASEVAARLKDLPSHDFFASVAFKYQPADPCPGAAALAALELGMLPTTSGSATGRAPPVSKLQAIRESIGPTARLALASGVDPENAAILGPWVSDVLVSTGIAADFHRFDPAKLNKLKSTLDGMG